MHRDKKIGLALGILLVGIVAAFFFRNEPDPFAELPPLEDPEALDAQIIEKPIAPYTEQANPSSETPVAAAPKNPWDLSDLYRPHGQPLPESEGLPISPGAPAPIHLAEPIPAPGRANRMIEVGSPFGDSRPAKPNPANQAPLPGNEGWTSVPEQPLVPAMPPPQANLAKTPPPSGSIPSSPVATYTIQQGDTLSVLAEKHLGSSRRYVEIYEANRDKLRNPDDIKVGMLIRIPPRVKFRGGNPAPENTPPAPPKETTILPPPEEAARFTPFSRSPLAPGLR